jgi:hypothetical protein
MKRIILAAAVAGVIAGAPVEQARAGMLRDALTSCAFGGGAFAALTWYYVGPAAAAGAPAVLVAEVVAANAALGCGVAAVGSVSAGIIGGLYDAIF